MSHKEGKEQPADISNLQESFSKQQKKISALKELARKSEVAHGKSTTTAQEKVKNIAQRLTLLKSKARSRQSSDVPQQDAKTVEVAEAPAPEQPSEVFSQSHLSIIASPSSSNYSTPNLTPLKPHEAHSGSQVSFGSENINANMVTTSSEKILFLRQQMQQNRELMAKRASSKQHLEQLVTQLKEKFDTTQQCLEDTSELGKSMTNLNVLAYTPVSRERHKSATDLSTQPFSLEKERIKFLENRCRLLEKQLEKEKQTNVSLNESSSSQASTKRIKELENKVLELEEVLKEQQLTSEDPVATGDNQWTAELARLRNELAEKDIKINNLQQKLDEVSLETHDTKALELENERLRCEVAQHLQNLANVETSRDEHSENRQESEQMLKSQLQNANERLEATREELLVLQANFDILKNENNIDKTDNDVKAAMAKQIQELEGEIAELRTENIQLKETLHEKDVFSVSDVNIAEKISTLEATIETLQQDLATRTASLEEQSEKLMEKTIELNVLNANFKVVEEKLRTTSKNKPLFSSSNAEGAEDAELRTEIQNLKQKLNESNKATLKLSLKCKKAEKRVEKLENNTDLHAEVAKLDRANEELQLKIIELEDEKGQWQLTQVEDVKPAQTNELPGIELETQYKTQAKKLQKAELEVIALRERVNRQDSRESARVKSEMSEIHLEEKLEEQAQELQTVQDKLHAKEAEITELKRKLQELQVQKQGLDKKLEHYINENIELLDKVEKLSKSSSSAESIEIVERPTQQERAEMDEFNKRLEQEHMAIEQAASSVSELTQTEMGPELSESLVQLREESSELMNKIELFTTERREVLEKMEHLTAENQDLIRKMEDLTEQRDSMETNALLAENAKAKLESKMQELSKEKDLLASQVAESTAQKMKLSQDLTSLQKSSEVVAAIDTAEGATLFEKCEKSLAKLDSELETYRRANDKNAKFNASKKLAKEAKNAHTQLSELLQKVKEASTAVETVTVVETVVAVTAPNGKALAEYEQLTAQNRELKATVDELRRELQENRDMPQESSVEITELPVAAIQQQEQHDEKELQLQKTLKDISAYEQQCGELQTTVGSLRRELRDALQAGEERSSQITQLNEELNAMRKMSDGFDQLMNDKEISFEKHIEQLTRLRKELEGKCETYEGEMEILQTLVTEQKQQLIEAYKESEHEVNLKLLDLQQRDKQIASLRAEISELKQTSAVAGEKLSSDLQTECENLREKLKINKVLVAEQINELGNKQETIEALNQQIIDLYKSMEENTNKVIEKEDEIAYVQELLDTNTKELERLRKDNNEQKLVVDKLLSELHSHRSNLPQLEADVQRLEQTNQELTQNNKELEQRNKDQLEKLKKYAANLKKRAAHCQELEAKVKEYEEKGTLEATHTKEHDLEQHNMSLNEKVKGLELQLEDSQKKLEQVKETLQVKLTELLTTVEHNAALERELHQTQQTVEEKLRDIEQLQNTIADSKDQELDWGMEAPVDNTKYDELCKELTDKTSCLERAEQDLNEVQAELLQMHENERERQQALNELQQSLQHKNEIVHELEQQLVKAKTQQQQEQQAQHQAEQQHDELQRLQQQMLAQQQRLNEVGEELKGKSLKFEKSKAVIKERNNQIHRLQAQLKDLQDKLSAQPEEEPLEVAVAVSAKQTQLAAVPAPATALAVAQVPQDIHDALKQAYEQLSAQYKTDKSNFQETIGRLETLHDGIQAKVQENISYIETLEQENMAFKEKIYRLEECVATFEERRASMERQANLLDEQLQSRTHEYEKTEDELVHRLELLSAHDDIIARRLLEAQEEKEELLQRVEHLRTDLKDVNAKYSKLQNDYKTYQDEISLNAETEQSCLREKLLAAESEAQRLKSTYESRLAVKTTELDELECELQEQLSKLNAEKRALSENCEKAVDECTAYRDEIMRLNESLNAVEQAKQELEREATWLRMQQENAQQDQYELQELRMQTMQDKTENDNLRLQIDALATNHESELQSLRTQIAELDSLRMQVGQNQTDDQVFIETENKRLTELLAEKEALIENYQRQNLQLQMAATTTNQQQQQHQQVDPLALAFGFPAITQLPQTAEERERLERQLLEKSEAVTRLEGELSALQVNLQNMREQNTDLQRQLTTNSTSTSATITQQMNDDVIPAPPMFFASEQMTPSPFDEIVQVRTLNPLEGAALTSSAGTNGNVSTADSSVVELQTIENLQRNVSDLEKHAQDLEHKLAARNQRESEHEERLRELENRLQEREQQLQKSQLDLQAREQQNQVNHTQKLAELSGKLTQVEQQLKLREQELQAAHAKCQAFVELAEKNARDSSAEADAVQRMEELQNSLEHLQKLLEERDSELQQLRRTMDEEKHMKDTASALESLIIPEPVVKVEAVGNAQMNVQPTLDMFFGSSTSNDFENLATPQDTGVPVVEEVIVPKKAYLCYPTDGGSAATSEIAPQAPRAPAIAAEALDMMMGDDWGDAWGSKEAAAEAAHFSSTQSASGATVRQSLVPREQQLEIQLQETAERAQDLELALERSEQQKQDLQTKSGKLVKKLKEYKAKLDELQVSSFRKSTSVESNPMFSDLDAAIQEELKTQIKHLEEKLEDERKAQEHNAVEKEKLLKRIDVLTAGNERMSEMKERQDMDMQMYQARIHELQEKLNQLDDWGVEGGEVGAGANASVTQNTQNSVESTQKLALDGPDAQLQQKIAELTAEIQDINGDRQELQALLEEEKASAAQADGTIRTLLEKIAVLDNASEASEAFEKTQYNDLKLEYENLQKSQRQLEDMHKSLQGELQTAKAAHGQQAEQIQQLQRQETELQEELKAARSKIEQLQSEIQRLRGKVLQEEEEYTDSQLQAFELRIQNNELSESKKELEAESRSELAAANRENEGLRIDSEVGLNRVQELERREEQLRADMQKLRNELEHKEEEQTASQLQMLELRTRNDELTEINRELGAVSDEVAQLRLDNNALALQVKELEQQRSNWQESPLAAATMYSTMSNRSEDLSAQLQEKESEILHLRQRVEDLMREDQTEKLVLEILAKNQEIHTLKVQVKDLESDKQEMEHNLTLQITKEMQTANREEAQVEATQLQQRIASLETQLRAAQTEKSNMEEELKVLNNHVLSSLEQEDKLKSTLLELDTRNIEISELRRSLETVKQQQQVSTELQAPAVDINALNAQWEALVEQRCGEIAHMWQEHLENRELEFKHVEARLQEQIVALQTTNATITVTPAHQAASAETTATSTPASVSTSASVSSSAAASKDGTPLRARFINEADEQHAAAADAIIEKMQAALESQEMEIVTLKEQLAIRSAEYARLAAQYDPFKLQTTLSHSGMSMSGINAMSGPASLDSPQTKRISTGESNVVPKSELDLAMYMLHQRDMRCEEMTLELVSLLEERDTLQLKLSNTLRQLEAVKEQTGCADPNLTQAPAAGPLSMSTATFPGAESPSKSTVAGTTGNASTDELSQKLSQLQTVKHSKDKIIKEEREQRIRQMERIQQDVAKIPPAALSELVGADLSQSSQSPSSVLLNWLWGNKPPSPPNGGATPN